MRSDTDCKVLPHPCNRDEAECRRSAPARPLPHTANHKPQGKRGIHAITWRVRSNVGISASDDVFADPSEASSYSTARRLTG
ncbi:hypothetical protein KW867_33765, partial [Pseudomonas aeruginosa]|uniref:hypothetical protein n=1 Tax=Pseudomonas aeruginosa TaxID=287 RepID=UPI001B36FE7D